MPPNSPSFLIIAGAEKCGTTSLFGYLAAHPDTEPSLRKETDYFRRSAVDLSGYLAQFPVDAAHRGKLLVESSPGYLAEAVDVAPRLATVAPHARLVFVLRDPIERLRSSFRFYKNRLHVPASMSFDTFARICLAHEQGRSLPAEVQGIQAWHLDALSRGRYERLLRPFAEHFPAAQRLVLLQSALTADSRAAMRSICCHGGLDPTFFDNFAFTRENVSFMVRRQGLQRMAIGINDRLESLWRRHPGLKRQLLAIYKRVNQRPLDADQLAPDTSAALREWYAPTFAYLAQPSLRSPVEV